VRASDIRLGIERVLLRGTAPATYYTGIRGARRCVAKRARCDLSSGVEVDNAAGTITFRLTAPDPDFLDKLALPSAVAVPSSLGFAKLARPLPATGPYQVARLRPPTIIDFVRNPHFRAVDGRPDGYPDTIILNDGTEPRRAIRAVEQGRADYIGGDYGLPANVLPSVNAIATRYAGQLHTTLRASTVYAFLNTRIAPFDNVDARRAVNYAVDRNAFVALRGGERFAQPTCQTLPSNFPGYRPYCPYTANAGAGKPWSAPDLAHARRLVARSHTRGMHVTVVAEPSFLPSEARLLKQVLERLGYRTSLRSPSKNGDYFGYVANSHHRAQIGTLAWGADYPEASGFLQVLFSCAAFVPGDPNQTNDSEFCDPHADRLMRRAQHLPAGDPGADAVGQGRPAHRGPGRRASADQPQGDRLRLATSRQLPVQPAMGRHVRPALGALSAYAISTPSDPELGRRRPVLIRADDDPPRLR
jgi:peptide/nickel transport system substrate-binding protein